MSDQLAVARTVDHSGVFPDMKSASGARSELAALGYGTHISEEQGYVLLEVQKVTPIDPDNVEKFTEETGVTQKYKTMIGKYGFAARFLGKDATDLDGYVTQKALDGLFFMVSEEERKIRKDPIGRTTSLLKKVFGILK